MEKPSQFQLDIASSNSFIEFRMKNNLNGLYDVPEREIIKQLIKEYFIEDYICGDYNVYKERPKILKWLEEMVIVKVFKFDDYNECISLVGVNKLSKTDIIESFLNSNRLILEFVEFLLNECKINPNIKNMNNVCFMDYISKEYYETLIEK